MSNLCFTGKTARLFSVALLAFSSASALTAGETVIVDNVVSLTNELDRLNRRNSEANKNLGDVLILKKGEYDVSDCHMLCDSANTKYLMSTSHLALAWITIKGETDNPRDVVIYGDKSDRILYAFMGKVHNLTISNGCRTADSVGGGGVCGRNQGTTLSNVVITCCSAAGNGGGAYYPNCYDCVIEKCHSDQNGGGIYFSYLFQGGSIVSNTATLGGGGAANACLNGVYIAGNSAFEGGGVKWDMSGSTGTTNCVVTGNIAEKGGGFCYSKMVYNCVISNNVAIRGGGIFDSHVHRCDIVHNLARAVEKDDKVMGGGACAQDIGNCLVYDSLVAGNACALELVEDGDRSGGAGEKVRFYGCLIRDNFARVGASLNWGSAEDCIISNNVSPLYFHNARGTKYLTRCTIIGDSLTAPGAVSDCEIKNYNGRWELPVGANVYTNGVFDNSEHLKEETYRLIVNNINTVFSITNSLIHGNRAYSIIAKDKTGVPVNVVNCTIVNNTNVCMYGGFRTNENVTALYLKNTIICGNKSLSSPKSDLNFHPQYGSVNEANVHIENCIIGPGGKGTGQTQSCVGLISSNDPKFSGYRDTEHPYSLRRNSPGIGKGTVEDWMTDAYDLRGDADGGKYLRIRDGRVDIGCYQCWLDPIGTVLSIR